MADRVTKRAKLGLWSRIKRLALTDVGALARGFRAADVEAMERLLLEADFGVAATTDLVEMLEDGVRRGRLKSEDDLKAALIERITQLLAEPPSSRAAETSNEPPSRRAAETTNEPPSRRAAEPSGLHRAQSGPTVVLVVGVNGSGKTTSIAKLARRLTQQGDKVLLAAADTFRAGAIDQLGIWAERLGLELVAGTPGGDPAAVAFDAIGAAQSRNASVVIVDTAGRLHTQEGLMEELRKVVRVIGRKAPGAPHETLLVLDGTVGQNAVQQGKMFMQAVNPTGLIVTKLDGTARGGAVVALRRELSVPIRFLGTGESASDLEEFDPRSFAEDLLG